MKKILSMIVTASMCTAMLAGCGGNGTAPAADAGAGKAAEGAGENDDKAKAQAAAALIDAIYVQERTDTTDADCKAAKEAWDALTEDEKELVEGENADPDYFGRDTGDASKDDPANADNIGDK
ncbi:MAG: cobalt chelatase, partial [Lachnospiraceae bacterium]|nr:cobalt chelatase [Lachnospiraceae bacterium]